MSGGVALHITASYDEETDWPEGRVVVHVGEHEVAVLRAQELPDQGWQAWPEADREEKIVWLTLATWFQKVNGLIESAR